jgi:hypothetical protein
MSGPGKGSFQLNLLSMTYGVQKPLQMLHWLQEPELVKFGGAVAP